MNIERKQTAPVMSGGTAADQIETPGIEAPGIEALRARIRVLERGGGAAALRVLPLGPAALDERLPGGGLPVTGLHEIEGERAEWDDGVASGFCLALLARLAAARDGLAGPVLWAAAQDDLYAPGLAGFGLDPGRLLLVRAGNDRDVLWALEEGLRSGSLGAVVGEVTALDRTAGRRLQLATEAAGLPCFLLRRPRLAGRGREGPSAAVTRWRVAPLPSLIGPSQAKLASDSEAAAGLIGRPRWRVALLRCRGAAPADFVMEWDHATGAFALAAALRDGPLGPRPADGIAPADLRVAV
ncbi:MAG: ImuA family protein [Kiloniellales bacterium]